MTKIEFYRAFEDRHRGSRELIKSRLAVYLPFILPLKKIGGFCQGIDLGCGRGEWLELMQEYEIDVRGVDLDLGMLESAQERDLNVSYGDAIAELQSLSDESLSVISGFHLAEHLPFDVLQTLIKESLRVLKPGGLLILETPNPENIVVGSANFYVDPTHQRPIPFQLLSFMVEYAGFEKVKVLRLQESTELATNNALSLLDVLSGVSPDYAVVAQKGGAIRYTLALAPAFEADYGISLKYLADRYNQQAEAKAEQAEAKAEQAEAKAEQAEAKAEQAEAKAEQAEAASGQILTQLHAVYASTSWRITAPLRMIGYAIGACSQVPKKAKLIIKTKIRTLLIHARLYVNRSPKIKGALLAILRRFPSLKSRINRAMINANRMQIYQRPVDKDLQNLTPHARQIYADLKTAIEQRQKGLQ